MGRRNKFKCIYVLLAPERAAYVGQTTDPINRKSRYKTMTCKNQTDVYASLVKHGYPKHEFKIILRLPDSATRDMLDFWEKFYFSLYKEVGYRMLNLKSPGWNGRPGVIGAQKAWNKGLKKSDYANR